MCWNRLVHEEGAISIGGGLVPLPWMRTPSLPLGGSRSGSRKRSLPSPQPRRAGACSRRFWYTRFLGVSRHFPRLSLWKESRQRSHSRVDCVPPRSHPLAWSRLRRSISVPFLSLPMGRGINRVTSRQRVLFLSPQIVFGKRNVKPPSGREVAREA